MSSIASSSHSGGDSLFQVKFLAVLRSGDPANLHPFLTELSKGSRTSIDNSENDLATTALHLAVRCGPCDMIVPLLSHRSVSPNSVYPPGSGTTPLHLAASLGREDVVNLLLEQPGIDDTLRDSHGRTCLEVAKGKGTVKAIKDSRAFLTASFRSLLRTYIMSPSNERIPDALVSLLSSPRIRLVDLSYLDDASGTTLLHEVAKRKDLRGIEIAIRAGADVFVRDRRGRNVIESVGKDDRVKVFLRQFANQDSTLIEPPSTEPPEHKGYLNKYTNVAKGYNTRWFVLRNGVLSYFRHQEDENVASRGSIAMKTAVLKNTPGSGGLRFEVHSTPTRGTSGAQKWYIKANHPVEASRWIQALTKSIEWAQREAEKERMSMESDLSSLKPPSTKGAPSHSSRTTSRKSDVSGLVSGASSLAEDDADHHNDGEEHREKDSEESSVAESQRSPPHNDSFELHGYSAVAQVDLTSQLLTSLFSTPTPPTEEMKKAVLDAFGAAHSMLSEYVGMVKEREDWWKDELKKEHDRQNIWEESLKVVVKEGQVLEDELRNRSRRRSRMVDPSYFTAASVSEMGTLRNRPSHLAISPPGTATLKGKEKAEAEMAVQDSTAEIISSMVPETAERQIPITLPRPPMISPTNTIVPTRPLSIAITTPPGGDRESIIDTDEEDEFFDAIESNTLPLLVSESLANPTHPGTPINANISNTEQYSGYAQLRDRLAITTDDRPPMSLWAVLKNSIGKDLTKISFPVFFNEPTSMLQRMAEDMEFSECLDAAASERDPHRRIAFVAAFAMSNYSSTIGRIAKPFNPMLVRILLIFLGVTAAY
ncbi:hypothetical protein QCA50_008734 [Cerrena zonata]|uniref:PH domain-containing protein n=1 Tax=Cerrena zonata TaxID=2478898 RepID=A0AAW0GEI5_9APHY